MSLEKIVSQHQNADLLRIATAGSVDDGKSTLIGRLLYDTAAICEDHFAAVERDSKKLQRATIDFSLLTDGLKAEREQGITIDVAYRYFATPKRRFIIADTPGHEQYTRNMVTGASTADVALLLIDARLGVLTQSKRHAFIASLLGIKHVMICVNKMDLVDYSQERFEEIRDEYAAFATKLGIPDLVFVPVSAINGDNITEKSDKTPWYQGAPLLKRLEEVYVGGDRNLVDFRFPVQYVNRPNLNFRGFAGQLASGVVRKGEEVTVLPSGKTSKVKSIETFEGPIDYAFAPQSVTLTLEDEIDISRGDMIAHPNNLPKTAREVDATLVWMSETPMRTNFTYRIRHSTNMVRGQVSKLSYRIDPNNLHREDAKQLGLNEIGRVEIELFSPILVDAYTRNRGTGSFIVIDPISNSTVGAGIIIEREKTSDLKGIQAGKEAPVSKNITPTKGLVSAEDRERRLGQRPATLWLTGLSGSGKSTLAYQLEKQLFERGHLSHVLDGDNIRGRLNRDLSFDPKDRKENIRRVAEVSGLFNDAGVLVISSFISPYREDRDAARELIGGGRFIEVFVDAPLEVCEDRDPKGLYRKARAGDIPGFTGVTAPYEAPEKPEVHVQTHRVSPEEAAKEVIAYLEREGFLR